MLFGMREESDSLEVLWAAFFREAGFRTHRRDPGEKGHGASTCPRSWYKLTLRKASSGENRGQTGAPQVEQGVHCRGKDHRVVLLRAVARGR